MKFDEVIMFEPDSVGMQEGVEFYKNDTDIKFVKENVRVGTRDPKSDILSFMKRHFQNDDFVVLKFDVDNHNSLGPTMEWGFLADLVYSEEIALVDELYIELHYRLEKIGWMHNTHSARQRYDIVRQLRLCGLAIHDWP